MADTDDVLAFPDGPKQNLDTAIDELVRRASEVQQSQGRLRALLRANQSVTEQLDLATVLRRIVESAVELVGAQYGALGVIAPSGGLEQFIHVGMNEGDVGLIGHLPEGHGLLGALIDDPHPIRLEHIGDDSRSAGFPAHHPSMDSFLGVPIRVREEVFGNLYLTNQGSGRFSPEDEQLARSLAATAGFAIENARLFAETRRRQAWSAASAEVTAAMLSADSGDALLLVADKVLALAEADHVAIVIALDGAADAQLVVEVARGIDGDSLAGFAFPAAGSIAGSVLEGGQPLMVNDGSGTIAPLSSGATLGAVMALPIAAVGHVEGVLIVGRLVGSRRFVDADLEMAADFAGQAGIALQLIRSRSIEQTVMLADDRSRIARDLHDHVIQQLFGAGLELQSVATTMPSSPAAERISVIASRLDESIAQIRTAIFALQPVTDGGTSIRHRLIDIASEVAPLFERTPSVRFGGPVDLIVIDALADDVLAVAREGLTNAGKYAGGASASLTLNADDDWLTLEIEDDGRGIVTSHRSGLANLHRRATRRAGTFEIASDDAGTRLTWRVPVDTGAAGR